MFVWQSAVLAETRWGQVWIGADVPMARGETGCFIWVIQQSKVVGCCPGVQALTVRRCLVITLVDMLAVEVANIQDWGVGMSGWSLVWVASVKVCRRWWSYILRLLRTTTQSLIVLETDWPVTIPTAHGQTWQGCDSCSGLTQLVRSWKSLVCLQLCSGSPVGRWWKPCSYWLAAQWRRSCFRPWRRQTYFLPRVPSNLVTPCHSLPPFTQASLRLAPNFHCVDERKRIHQNVNLTISLSEKI